MNDVLVDTDVLSFIFKGDTRADLYARHLDGRRHSIALMTVAESRAWAIRSRWGIARLRSLEEMVGRHTVLSPNLQTAELWASISAHRARAGRRIETSDCWIAATAVQYQLPLVTHNGADYADIPGLIVLSRS